MFWPIHLSECPSILHMFVHPSIHPSTHSCSHLSDHPSNYSSVHSPAPLSIHPSIQPSIPSSIKLPHLIWFLSRFWPSLQPITELKFTPQGKSDPSVNLTCTSLGGRSNLEGTHAGTGRRCQVRKAPLNQTLDPLAVRLTTALSCSYSTCVEIK